MTLPSKRPFTQAQKVFISELSSHISGLASAWQHYFRYEMAYMKLKYFPKCSLNWCSVQ
jgi:hypothetical protein